MADAPSLDSADIQGNILPGFRREQQLHLGYMAPSETVLRGTLKVLANYGITSLATAFGHKEQRKMAFLAGTPQPKRADLWLNLALGAAALDRLGDGAIRKLDAGFDVGMRPSRTGDPWRAKDDQGNPNPSHPSNWKVGSPSRPLDLLVIAAYDDPVAAGIDALLASLAATGIQEVYREAGVRLANDQEHFGFADGISQVGVLGTVEIEGVRSAVTTRYGVPAQDGVEFGKPGQPLVWPGQFLVGAATGANSVDNAPARYRNGSFLVFRRLSQDIRAFDADTAAIAQAHSTPEKPLTAEHLRAMIVGRWPSGAALMRHQNEPVTADNELSANYFLFGAATPDLQLAGNAVTGAKADPSPPRGLQCPVFAHIRKVNPRDLPTDKGDRDRTRSFQMLRRGIPFGPPYDRVNPESAANLEPRGLLFFAYQRAISLQFERLNTDWMNTEKGPADGGFDLLVGQNVATNTGLYLSKSATLYSAPAPAPGEQVVAPANWVKPTGGAYLFAPSLSHIRSLAEPEFTPAVEHLFAATASFRSEELFAKKLELPEPVFPQHDGETQMVQKAGRKELVEGHWPATALLPPAALALSGANVEKLDLSGDHFPTEVLPPNEALALAADPWLESLQLDGTSLAGVTIATLVRSLPYVTSLNLAGCDLDDADIATLAEIHPSLLGLTIGLASPRNGHRFTAPRLTPRVLQGLTRLSKLRHLSLRGVLLSDDAVTGTRIWRDLAAIDLGETPVGDASALHLAQSAALRELRLDQTAVGDVGATALLARPLDTLSLSWSRVTVNGLIGAPALPSLGTLHLAGLAMDDQLAPVLGQMTSLREIDLSNTAVADRVAATLAGLTDLTSINIAQTSITRSGLAQLAASMSAGSAVATLDATRLPADREIFNRLGGSRSLRKVTLSAGTDWRGIDGILAEVHLEARVPDAGGPPPRLTSLRLSGDFSADVAPQFAGLRWLQTIALYGSAKGANFGAGFKALRDLRAERAGLDDQALATLVKHPRMEALYISGNSVAGAFEDWHGAHIHTLELRDTLIDDRALQSIATLPKLHCLDVPGSHVTAAGIAMLAQRGYNLQSLALDGRQVDAASAHALAAHNRLAEIYLYGAAVDLSTLRVLTSVRLRELSLIGTSLTDEAVPILAGMPGLRRLSLGSELSDAGIESLQALRPDLTLYRNAARPISPRRH
jgi:Dyp-type peroxidase family